MLGAGAGAKRAARIVKLPAGGARDASAAVPPACRGPARPPCHPSPTLVQAAGRGALHALTVPHDGLQAPVCAVSSRTGCVGGLLRVGRGLGTAGTRVRLPGRPNAACVAYLRLSIPSPPPCCRYGYYLLAAQVLRAASPPLALMTAQEAALGGAFRGAHQRLVQHAEEIAVGGVDGWVWGIPRVGVMGTVGRQSIARGADRCSISTTIHSPLLPAHPAAHRQRLPAPRLSVSAHPLHFPAVQRPPRRHG